MMKIDERNDFAIFNYVCIASIRSLPLSLIRLRFVEFEKNKESLVIGLGLSIAGATSCNCINKRDKSADMRSHGQVTLRVCVCLCVCDPSHCLSSVRIRLGRRRQTQKRMTPKTATATKPNDNFIIKCSGLWSIARISARFVLDSVRLSLRHSLCVCVCLLLNFWIYKSDKCLHCDPLCGKCCHIFVPVPQRREAEKKH